MDQWLDFLSLAALCLPSARFDAQVFRVLLLRRLWCPLPLSGAICRCGRPLDSRGHHRAACHLAGVLGHRGFSLESAAARICREAGARVSQNVRVQDLDLLPLGSQDNRRIEIIADGLPLFHGAHLAVDTTMVSALRADGNPRRQSDVLDGATLSQARRRKDLTYPELTGEHGKARLVVLACEVGGRWFDETCHFIAGLARAKARSEPRAIRAAASKTSMAPEMEHIVVLLWSSRFWSVPSGETASFGC